MWKWLIIIGAGYFLFRMFMNDKKHKTEDKQDERENLIASGDLVKDPICGTFIDKDSAISVRDAETVHRFCSYECRDAFLEERKAIPENATNATENATNATENADASEK